MQSFRAVAHTVRLSLYCVGEQSRAKRVRETQKWTNAIQLQRIIESGKVDVERSFIKVSFWSESELKSLVC